MGMPPGKLPSSGGTPRDDNRRQHFRVKMLQPVEISVNVVGSKLPVLLLDLSAGGMRFLSDVKFPVTSLYVYEVEFNLINTVNKISGHVLRMIKISDDLYDYGFIFESEDREQFSNVFQLVNELSILLRRNPQFNHINFPISQRLWQSFQMFQAKQMQQQSQQNVTQHPHPNQPPKPPGK